MRRLVLIAGLLLAACNLQQQPPTPTPQPTAPESQLIVTVTPQGPSPALPTLLPTPTQWTLVTATLSAGSTPINSGSVEGLPTLDAALADERYEITARAGATVGVNYEVVIDSTGVVSMTMQGPEGVVWQKSFTTSESGRDEVVVEQGGTYEILVYRQNLDGSYSVSWD